MNLINLLHRVYRHAAKDDLYRNSLFLIISSAITSIAGFGFWTICARLYKPQQVGIATTLVSAVTLLSTISLLGYNNSIIKFMHYNEFSEKRVRTSITFVGLISGLTSILFLCALPLVSPKLIFIYNYPVFLVLFVLTVVLISVSTLLDSSFVAFQKASAVLMKNTVASISKLSLPFVVVSFGALGIFFASTLSIVISIVLGILFLSKFLKMRFHPTFDKTIISEMAKFSFANYAAGLVEGLSATLLPLLITNRLNPTVSGYFYIDMMIASAIYVVPIALSQVIFAQGSKDSAGTYEALLKAIRFIYALLIPIIIILIVLGKYILAIFGSNYSNSGYVTLVLLVLAGIPVAIKLLSNAILNIEHQVRYIIYNNIVTTLVVLIISVLYVHKGINAIGAAWLIGETCGAVVALYFLRFKSKVVIKALGKYPS